MGVGGDRRGQVGIYGDRWGLGGDRWGKLRMGVVTWGDVWVRKDHCGVVGGGGIGGERSEKVVIGVD